MSLLSVRDLSIALGGRPILRNVSFDLRPGEFVSLVGPNGAGKTTLLRCIARIYEGWEGDILWQGVSARRFGHRQWAKLVAYLPQHEHGAIPYTVEEFVLMARYPHAHPFAPPSQADREAARQAMVLTETWSWRHRVVRRLSGGERQKVLLACVLAQQAPLLLLDEATTFLDFHHREEVQRLLTRIKREQGVSILAVTHDVNAAALLSDRIVALGDGRVVFVGTPEKLMQPDVLGGLFGFQPVTVPHPQTGIPMVLPSLPGGDA